VSYYLADLAVIELCYVVDTASIDESQQTCIHTNLVVCDMD